MLELFSADRPEWGVSEAAKALGFPKSSTSALMSALTIEGLLQRTDARRYILGWRIVGMSQILLQDSSDRSVPLRPDEDAVIAKIRAARKGRYTVRRDSPNVDIKGGYRVQAVLGVGRELRGYRLGLLSRAEQNQMGNETLIYGRIYEDMLLDNPVGLGRFVQPRVQPEVAAVLGDDVLSDASPSAACLGVSGFFLGAGFLDSVWSGYRFEPGEVVADNASGGGFLLGQRLPDGVPWKDLRMLLNGRMLSRGLLQDLGKPGKSLAWLSQEVGGLKAGQVVFLGSPVGAAEARPGVLQLHGPGGSSLVVEIGG